MASSLDAGIGSSLTMRSASDLPFQQLHDEGVRAVLALRLQHIDDFQDVGVIDEVDDLRFVDEAFDHPGDASPPGTGS